MPQKLSWIFYVVLHLSFKGNVNYGLVYHGNVITETSALKLQLRSKFISANGLKCRVCNDAEWSPNQQYYAGRCEKELDPGNLETHCSVEGTQFCLKLKITFDPEVKRRTKLLEKNLESVLSERDKDEMLKVLKSRKTLISSL